MLENTTTNTSLYTKLTKELSKYFPLPNAGIIAGQAVAESYFRVHNLDIASRYKDLDLFLESDSGSNVGLGRATETALSLKYISGYGEVVDTIDKGGYFIVSSTYDLDTKVNTVGVETSGELTAENILKGFDINAVNIAIDLTNKKVVIDPSFEEFVKTKTLKLTTLHTPVSSFIRIIDKAGYISNVKIDIDAVAKQVSMGLSLRYFRMNDCEFFIQGTGISVARFNLLSPRVKDVLQKYLVVEHKQFVFHRLDEDDIFKAVVFKPVIDPALDSVVPFSVGNWIIRPFRNNLEVVNNLIDNLSGGKLDKSLYEAMNRLSHLDCVNQDVFMPWLFIEWVKGNSLSVSTCRFHQRAYDDYVRAYWLHSTCEEFFKLSVFESFCLFHEKLSHRRELHLMREFKWCIISGITDAKFIDSVIHGVTQVTLKKPSIVKHKPDYFIVNQSATKVVRTWQELVQCFPFKHQQYLYNLWEDILANVTFVTYKEISFGVFEIDAKYVSNFRPYEINNGYVVFYNPIKVLKRRFSTMRFWLQNIRSFFIKKKPVQHGGFTQQPSLIYDYSLPF